MTLLSKPTARRGNLVDQLQDLFAGLMGEKPVSIYRFAEPDIKVAALSIPAIPAGTRHVAQINLGTLNNPLRPTIGFFSNSAVDTNIKALGTTDSVILVSPGLAPGVDSIPGLGYPIGANVAGSFYIQVSENYIKTSRTQGVGGGQEKYGPSQTVLPRGMTYEGIGAGVLVGYYFGTNVGVLGLDKWIEIEGAWVEQVDGETLLNIAFNNQDSAANTASNLKVAVYE